MRGYNIYYGSDRLNSKPFTSAELADLQKTGVFVKKARFSTKSQQYPLSKCRVVEVIVL